MILQLTFLLNKKAKKFKSKIKIINYKISKFLKLYI